MNCKRCQDKISRGEEICNKELCDWCVDDIKKQKKLNVKKLQKALVYKK